MNIYIYIHDHEIICVEGTLNMILPAHPPTIEIILVYFLKLFLPSSFKGNSYHCNKGVCHTVALPFTLKLSILRQKKNYGNSNISPCKNIIFKKSSKRNQNPSRYYNSIITNLKFQHKPKYHLSKILI
jgi:hypothetical protein